MPLRTPRVLLWRPLLLLSLLQKKSVKPKSKPNHPFLLPPPHPPHLSYSTLLLLPSLPLLCHSVKIRFRTDAVSYKSLRLLHIYPSSNTILITISGSRSENRRCLECDICAAVFFRVICLLSLCFLTVLFLKFFFRFVVFCDVLWCFSFFCIFASVFSAFTLSPFFSFHLLIPLLSFFPFPSLPNSFCSHSCLSDVSYFPSSLLSFIQVSVSSSFSGPNGGTHGIYLRDYFEIGPSEHTVTVSPTFPKSEEKINEKKIELLLNISLLTTQPWISCCSQLSLMNGGK